MGNLRKALSKEMKQQQKGQKLPRSSKKKNQSPNEQNERPRKKRKLNQKGKWSDPEATSKKSNGVNSASSRISKFKNPEMCIEWLLGDRKQFFETIFGSKSHHIKRGNTKYYSNAHLDFTLETVHSIIEDNKLYFGRHMIAKF